ncbi:Ig-like domain-containing protein, partial [Gemmatimonas sp.]|uniref:Ig-like domain-containing protein n=1 Tax=Gemmatimonas sp. TaxID=1962908 RepID=UPI0025BC2FB0
MKMLVLTLLVLVVAACGGDTISPPTPRLTSLTVAVAAPSIVAGTTTTASVSGRDQEGKPIATGPVTWTSSNSAVATVDGSGTVTGVAAGSATLTAAAGGISASVALTVTPAPALTRLTVALSTTAPRSGDRVTVSVSGFDQFNAPFPTPSFTVTSTAPTIAAVQSDGSVLAALVGTATIRVSVGAISGTADLTVSPGTAARLVVVRPASGIFSAWRFAVQPQVAVADLAGNRVTTDAGRAISVSVPGGVLGSATATTTTGIATFVDVGVLAATGTTTTLAFSAAGLTPIEQAITVAPFSFGGGTRL